MVFVYVCMRMYVHDTLHLWMPEDDFQELVLFFWVPGSELEW